MILKYQIHVKHYAETIPIFRLWKPLSPPILTLELHEFDFVPLPFRMFEFDSK